MQVKNSNYLVILFLLVFSTSGLMAQQNKKDEQGRKQGKWIKYKDGVKSYDGQFKDDYPYGEFLRYYPSGRLLSKSQFSDMGKKSLVEFYYDDRKHTLKAKGLYLEQKKDSSWSIYNESGILISKESYNKGIADGGWKLYNYLGGLVKETPYKEGFINGLQKEYFENGKPQRSISFTMDTIHGAFNVYFPEGQIRTEGTFEKGIQDKKWTYYETNGQILFIETYEMGELIDRLDAAGNPYTPKVEQDTVRLDINPAEMDFR